MKLTPTSPAFATIRADVASSVGPPNIMVPRQIGEIFRPLRPRLRYCIGWCPLQKRLDVSSLAPLLRGEGWDEGLLPRMLKYNMRADASTGRHCEPMGRANARPMTGSATKQ